MSATGGRTELSAPVRELRPSGGKRRRFRGSILAYALLAAGGVLMVFPFYWMIATAFDTHNPPPANLLPQGFTLRHWWYLWEQKIGGATYATFYWNSLIVSVAVTVVSCVTSALAGYVFAKFDFRGKRLMFIVTLATIMIPFQILLIPLYLMMSWAGLTDRLWALILPSVFVAFGIFLFRQYIHSIPTSLIESARIDGASELDIFLEIVLPLTKPALAAFSIFIFMWKWNDFLWPSVVIRTSDFYTLPIGLRELTANQYSRDYNLQMMGALVAIVPVLVVFLIMQKRFVEGITLSGMKT